MTDLNPLTWWRRFLGLPNTSVTKTVIVAALVALTCGILVSVISITLRPLHQANLEKERMARLQEMLKSVPGLSSLVTNGNQGVVRPQLVDLDSGTLVTDADPLSFDQRAAAADPASSVAIPDKLDIAGLGRRAKRAPVYFIKQNNALSRLILPVRGNGYQSMIYGYIVLEKDFNTIAAITFYEQGETPGLGSRIQETSWLSLWPGTKISDPEGNLRVAVAAGKASRPFEVDGISGATRTGNGVTNLLRYWLGAHGFGPFLKNLSAGKITP